MTKKFYITTTIPYANAPPHIGFALEIIQADILARWHRLLGEDVFFLTGTDEHGTKNYRMAKEQNLSPQEFVDKNSNFFKELTKKLNISNTNFIRTTNKKEHWPGVIKIWNALAKKGDIYKKSYEGDYCSGCERFITEKELVDGKCSNHPNLDIEKISEENYFFKLSKYSDKITRLIKEEKLKIYPNKWKNDFLALIKEGLTDVSFSRDKEHLPWGIPVPGDSNQVLYVWPDALTNYLTGIGFPDKRYKKYWPADIHVVGKDMLRFHTGIWPGMLLSAGLPLPKEVIVHGFLTVNGQKMSKSLGNVTSPLKLREKYETDTIRYILTRTIPFGDDGDFSEENMVSRHNSELADKLGNLVSRVSALCERYGIKKTPIKTPNSEKTIKAVETHFKKYEFDKALNEIFSYIDKCNEYIQKNKPWEKTCKNPQAILYELSNAIKDISIILSPFLPETSEKISRTFNFSISLKDLKSPLKVSNIKKADILFKKIELTDKLTNDKHNNKKEQNNNIKKPQDSHKPNNKIEGITKMSDIKYEDFSKLELKVATIEKAEDIEGADKLYKLSINLGKDLGKRTIVAGIKKHYTKEELKSKQIIVVCNLEPRTMKGIESHGMLLAASNSDDSQVILLSPEKKIEAGSKVR